VNDRSGVPGDLEALSPWVNELAQTFVSLSSDIALVLDAGGVITNVAQSVGDPMAPGAAQWIGRSWADTVTTETRRKIELLLGDVASTGLARRREVNHPGGGGGSDIPVAYTAIRLGAQGPVLAVGRDLRAIAAIQQRFLDAQQELERAYWRTRQAETRERALQQVATDALLVVDATTLAVVSANAAAGACVGIETSALPGRAATTLFDAYSRGPIEELLVTARGGGRPVELRARLAGSHAFASVAATPFRAGDVQRLLVRLRSPEGHAVPAPERRLAAAALGEAVVITDSSGRIRSCDDAFVALLGERDEAALAGRALADWMGDAAQPLDAVLAAVRRDGLLERGPLPLRAADRTLAVNLAASWLTESDQEGIGLVVQPVDAGPGLPAAAQQAVLRAWEVLDGQLGSASLPQMLREAAALAEQHFIQAALQRCGGDAAAAAQLLGVSRDNLGRRRRRSRRRGE
jgi:transcriptional regulator PpsR